MLDRTTLLVLTAAGLLVGAPVGRSIAASPSASFASMTSAAAADDAKGEWKHKDKDDEHDEKDDDHEKHARDEKQEKKEIEQSVPMNMVPQPAIDAVMKECPGGKITEAELVAKKGKIMYSFDVKTADMAYELKISVEGKFVSKKVDDDGDDEKDEKKPAMNDKK